METSSSLLLTYLLNACWQVALIALAAVGGDRLLQKSAARHRHILWATSLILSFCLPLLTTASLPNRALSKNLQTPPRNENRLSVASISSQPEAATEAVVLQSLPGSSSVKETGSSIHLRYKAAITLVALYVLFLIRRGFKLFEAWRRTKRMTRSAYAIEWPQQVRTTANTCQNVLGVARVAILGSASVSVPVTVGSLNPLIILPERLLRESDPNLLTTAIGHELAHIRRRDYLLNLIYELIYLPLSFHPAAVLVRRRINQTRELGCDELVTEKLLDAEVYARSLVHLAGAAIPLRRPITTITVGIADADILEERVMKMLKRSQTNVGGKGWLLIAASLCLAVPCMAAAPFALRININSPGPVPTAREVATARPNTPATWRQEAGQASKPIKQEAEQKEQQEKEAKREGRAEYQGQAYSVRFQDGQTNQNLTVRLAPSQEGREMREKTERMAKELQEREPNLSPKEVREREEHMMKDARMKEERAREERESQDPEFQAKIRAELEARAKWQANLAKEAQITMQQAIQIATSQYPGTVMESRLVREFRDQVCYYLLILSDNGTETTSTRVFVSAINGGVIKAVKEDR